MHTIWYENITLFHILLYAILVKVVIRERTQCEEDILLNGWKFFVIHTSHPCNLGVINHTSNVGVILQEVQAIHIFYVTYINNTQFIICITECIAV